MTEYPQQGEALYDGMELDRWCVLVKGDESALLIVPSGGGARVVERRAVRRLDGEHDGLSAGRRVNQVDRRKRIDAGDRRKSLGVVPRYDWNCRN